MFVCLDFDSLFRQYEGKREGEGKGGEGKGTSESNFEFIDEIRKTSLNRVSSFSVPPNRLISVD